MTAADAYGIAIDLADQMSKIIQFFIAICTAFGGWILAGKTIRQMPQVGRERFLVAVCFAIPTIGMVVAQIALSKRINGALEIASHRIKNDDEVSQYSNSAMFEPFHHWINTVPMLGVIGAVILLIRFVETTSEPSDSSESSGRSN